MLGPCMRVASICHISEKRASSSPCYSSALHPYFSHRRDSSLHTVVPVEKLAYFIITMFTQHYSQDGATATILLRATWAALTAIEQTQAAKTTCNMLTSPPALFHRCMRAAKG